MSKIAQLTPFQWVPRAACFAAEKHKNQRRKNKDKTPYINHPLEVSKLCAEAGYGNSPDVLCAALLHDVLEDTQTSYSELVSEFGDRIAEIVQECSDDKKLDKVSRKRLQIEHAKSISTQAKAVKMADKYSNLKDLADNPPAHWSKAEITGYAYWSYAVVRQLRLDEPDLEPFDGLFFLLWSKLGIQLDDEARLASELDAYYKVIRQYRVNQILFGIVVGCSKHFKQMPNFVLIPR